MIMKNCFYCFPQLFFIRRQEASKPKQKWFVAANYGFYANAPVEKIKLYSFMSDILNVGKNHSVRATTITVFDVAAISGRHSLKVSGHKSKTSLKSYSHFISDGKKREISEI